MKKTKKILASFLAFSLAFSATACGDFEDDYEEPDSDGGSKASDPDNGGSSIDITDGSKSDGTVQRLTMSITNNGDLQISRPTRKPANAPAADNADPWVIYVYLCGSDLESGNSMGTLDMQEMIEASTNGNVKFVVQTGGAASWSCEYGNQRVVIADGEIETVDSVNGNMGDSSALSAFLKWGLTAYPAEKSGLVLWNHGGGSITGVCFDENNDYDSLSLRELDAALLTANGYMSRNFEFIGFDACLMGTVETANILASYSNYMVGSQETEPGYGWDYTKIGDFIGSTPDADGAQVGKVIVDSFYDSCAEIDQEDDCTLSVIDLSKIDGVLTAFNSYSKEIYEASGNSSALSNIIRGAVSADNFGGNNKTEGYTNMVDLAGIVNSGNAYSSKANDVIGAVNEAVVYSRNGRVHRDACGLSVYYPLNITGSQELKVFGEVAVNPYYLSFVDRAAYGAANAGDLSSYDNSNIMDNWDDFDYDINDSGDVTYTESEEDYYEDYDFTAETSSLITFYSEPQYDDEGNYFFQLDEQGLDNASSVQALVYYVADGEHDLIEMGYSVDIYMDWDTGTFTDAFDGYWFSLPDGQNLAVYVVSECDGYDVYTSPVRLNGEDTNLRIIHDYTNDIITIDGAWDGIDENGIASRDIIKLKEGDVIVPLYYAMDINSDEEYTYIGEEYEFDGEPEIYYDYMADGDYLYGFSVDDIYGNYYISDFASFSIEDDQVYYTDI